MKMDTDKLRELKKIGTTRWNREDTALRNTFDFRSNQNEVHFPKIIIVMY